MLRDIMTTQEKLQERLGYNFTEMSNEERAAYMRDQRGYLADEIAEALYEMPEYKSWKDYSNMTIEERMSAWAKVKMELVDALHFFINLMLAAGFTPEELHSMYMAKNKENHRRQDAGYTSDVSYRSQSVEEVLREPEPSCMVMMDDTMESTNDFVAVLAKDDGGVALRYNTDALTMGMAAKILNERYHRMLDELDEEIQAEIKDVVRTTSMEESANA